MIYNYTYNIILKKNGLFICWVFGQINQNDILKMFKHCFNNIYIFITILILITILANLDHCYDKDKSKIPFECSTIIPIAADDPVYGPYNVTLFKFVRSTTSVNFSCPLTPRTVVSFFLYKYSPNNFWKEVIINTSTR